MTIEEKRNLIHELNKKYQESINEKDTWRTRCLNDKTDDFSIRYYMYYLGESEGLKNAIQIIDKTLEQINK